MSLYARLFSHVPPDIRVRLVKSEMAQWIEASHTGASAIQSCLASSEPLDEAKIIAYLDQIIEATERLQEIQCTVDMNL